jgi:hypothetical protein
VSSFIFQIRGKSLEKCPQAALNKVDTGWEHRIGVVTWWRVGVLLKRDRMRMTGSLKVERWKG